MAMGSAWRRWWANLARKSVIVNRITTVFGTTPASYSPADYLSFAHEGYGKNAYVFACILLHIRSCAGLPWGVYRAKYGARKRLEEVDLWKLLRRPSSIRTSLRAFLRELVMFWDIGGQAYVWANRLEDGRIAELINLRPDRVEIQNGEKLGEITKLLYRASTGEGQPLAPSEVLHLLTPNPADDYYGMSAMRPASRSIDQHNESKDWGVALLQNSARPSGALVAEHDLTDEQIERLSKELNRQDVGKSNAGRAMLLEGGLKWLQISMKPTDIDWLNGMNLSAREMAIATATPPELIFDSTNKVFANYREARRAYFEQTILPDMDYFRDEMNAWLAPYFGEQYVLDYDRDAIEALQDDREALWESLGNAWWLTIDEKRNKLGLESIENGNVLMVPANLIAVTPDHLDELSNQVLSSVSQAVQGKIGEKVPQNNVRGGVDNTDANADNTK